MKVFKREGKKSKDAVKQDGQERLTNSSTISGDINITIANIKNAMNNSFDIKSRVFKVGSSDIQGAVIYIDNQVNEDVIMDHLLRPLIIESTIKEKSDDSFDFNNFKETMFTAGEVKETEAFNEIVLSILFGDTFLTIQGWKKGLIINTKSYEGRAVAEPSIEPSVKGPQEAFVEVLKKNMALVRKRLRDPNLVFENYELGRRSKNTVVISYIKGIIDDDIVNDVRGRITALDLSVQPSTSELALYIVDNPKSIFPLYESTERPDKVVASLAEGRVAIMLEGSPQAILVPMTFPSLMQSADDYYQSWILASSIRLARYLALFFSSFSPALYISTTSFHPGMLPTKLVLSIAFTRAGVPFTAFLEALLMEIVLELLQEASIRLPRVIGQTVSIVGGLVLGQAAVQAGIVSPIMVIVISLSAVSSFAIPDYNLSLASRILRVPFMILAVTFGTFGIAMGWLMLITYLCSLKSFGIRYMSSIVPYNLQDWNDTFIRVPLLSLKRRPRFLNTKDKVRLVNNNRGSSDEG